MISCVEPTFCTLSLLSVTSEGNVTDQFSPAAYRIPGGVRVVIWDENLQLFGSTLVDKPLL